MEVRKHTCNNVVEVDEEQTGPPRGVKWKGTIKMIAKSDNFPDPAGDFDVREVENDDEGPSIIRNDFELQFLQPYN
ncbi:hypothetical protein GGU10DRAFT_381712 [Lentinula aff. detonsa]|uniref:Uncharacterized protein n=1 Tax=Lentinula aff. detonsa TaxID=2804958 RepID=A0AA38KB91_9AGAR|nr:hypothetical protein GGU10DRAFT_381712 [Lentinula aff. detonsa]